jgi:hypothetical protein
MSEEGGDRAFKLKAMREKLLDDEDTKQIASALGLEVSAYVDEVMKYAAEPGKEPVLQVLDDEEIEASGGKVPSLRDMKEWLEKVESGEIHLGPMEFSSDFEDDDETVSRKRASEMSGARLDVPPQRAPSAAGGALRAELSAGGSGGPAPRAKRGLSDKAPGNADDSSSSKGDD